MKKAKLIALLFITIQVVTLKVDACYFYNDEADSVSVRIMSFNIRRKGNESDTTNEWHNRLDKVVEVIQKQNPDILGLQEATEEQISDLQKRLNHYKSAGEGRGESWLGYGTNEYCPIFYNIKTMCCMSNITVPLNKPDSSFWIFNYNQTGWLPRICTIAKLKIKNSDKIVIASSLHLDNWYDKARKEQLKVACSAIEEKRKIDRSRIPENHMPPSIIMGDFNTPITPEIQAILTHYKHAKETAKNVSGPNETRTGFNDEELKEIDHIFVSDDGISLSVEEFGVIESDKPYPSDHRPIAVDIILP